MQLSIFRLPLASSKWLCGETVRHEEKIQFNRQSSEFSVDASKSQVEWDTKIQFRVALHLLRMLPKDSYSGASASKASLNEHRSSDRQSREETPLQGSRGPQCTLLVPFNVPRNNVGRRIANKTPQAHNA